jgi:tripartite-type tricarboxylate transporter receptor subunit TctC
VPTMRETMPELANYEVNTWFGIFGPAGMPNAMVQAINAEVNAWLDLPDTQRRFADLGGVPLKLSPEGFADFVAAETRKWAEVVQREGLQVEAG